MNYVHYAGMKSLTVSKMYLNFDSMILSFILFITTRTIAVKSGQVSNNSS